jgi:hypothetical protein
VLDLLRLVATVIAMNPLTYHPNNNDNVTSIESISSSSNATNAHCRRRVAAADDMGMKVLTLDHQPTVIFLKILSFLECDMNYDSISGVNKKW